MCATAKTNQQATTIKTGTWRRDFVGLEQRRLEAARMFAHGATQAEVARTFGVSAQAASAWYRRWHVCRVTKRPRYVPIKRGTLPIAWCGWPVIDGSTSRGCPVFMRGPWGQMRY